MTGKDLYRAICAEPTGLPVFLQHWWLDAVCDGCWDVAIYLKGQAVTGVWPYAVQQKVWLRMLRNPRLTPYLGPHIFYPPDIKDSRRDGLEHEVVQGLLEQMPDPPVWLLALQPGMGQAGLMQQYGMRPSVQQTFLIDLKPEEAQIQQRFREPLRRNIRQAADALIISDEPALLPVLHAWQEATLHRKGREQPYNLQQMQVLFEACRLHQSAALWAARARSDGQLQALVWHVWDRERSYYFMGAQRPEGADHRAISALLWHAMQQARQMGQHSFDLEGSMDPGVERFFRGFGGQRALYLVLRKNRSLLWRLMQALRP